MAKKVKNEGPSSSVDDIFGQLISQHNKRSNGIATLGSKMESEIKYYIDSGSMLLNMILSNREDGGWPGGRIVEVFGPESIGKSTISYVAMANTQKQGGIPIYADVERTGNKKFMEMFGINLDRLITTNEETVETLFASLEDNLTTIYNAGLIKQANLIVVDSVTSLQTDAELEAGYEYNMNIQLKKAMMLGKVLKKIIPHLSKTNTCLYLVNQVRENTTGYGEKFVVPGGKSIPFYASIRLQLSGKEKIVGRDADAENEYQLALAAFKALPKDVKANTEKPVRNKTDEVTLGYKVSAYTKKNKTAPPDRTAHFNIIFAEGVSDEECYLEYCEKYGMVKKSGAWYSMVHPELTKHYNTQFYASEWMKILTSSEELYKAVYDLLVSKLTIKIGKGTKFSEDKEEDGSEYDSNNNLQIVENKPVTDADLE